MPGQRQPIAVVPVDQLDYAVGTENLYAGKGDLYLMSYGSYFVAMNCTKKNVSNFDLPAEFVGAKDLVSGQVFKVSNAKISPMQRIVFVVSF